MDYISDIFPDKINQCMMGWEKIGVKFPKNIKLNTKNTHEILYEYIKQKYFKHIFKEAELENITYMPFEGIYFELDYDIAEELDVDLEDPEYTNHPYSDLYVEYNDYNDMNKLNICNLEDVLIEKKIFDKKYGIFLLLLIYLKLTSRDYYFIEKSYYIEKCKNIKIYINNNGLEQEITLFDMFNILKLLNKINDCS
jgi:hypothetical protein